MRAIRSTLRAAAAAPAVCAAPAGVPVATACLRTVTRVPRSVAPLPKSAVPARFQSGKPVPDDVVDDIIENEAAASRAAQGTTASTPTEHVPETAEVEEAEFQAETRKLLDIVACSIYTDKDIFIRELISNASDAISKLRHLIGRDDDRLSEEARDVRQEIILTCDEKARTISFQDHGIGMSRGELKSNLGTIARSGTQEFLRELNHQGAADASTIIGQFGVGFYSVFMCSKRARVYTKQATAGSKGYLWESDGSGKFRISECDGVEVGTKVVLELKESEAAYSVTSVVERTIKKYSNFVSVPIMLNGRRVNTQDALWLRDGKDITANEHTEFFRFLSGSLGDPLMHLVYKAEGPINANALFYIPARAPQGGNAMQQMNVSLYCRKVLIQPKTQLVLPEWMRFIVGVVDSEDLPLNISREHTQDSPLIRRLAMTVTKKVLRWLNEEAIRNPQRYRLFWNEWGSHVKNGVIFDPTNKKEIAKLLRYPSTKEQLTSFSEYVERIPTYQRAIFYMVAPDRNVAMATPYMEVFEKEGIEVLLPNTDADAYVMRHLEEFQKLKLVSIETAEASRLVQELKKFKREQQAVDKAAGKETEKDEKADADDDKDMFQRALSSEEELLFSAWLVTALRSKVREARPSTRLVSSPLMLADHALASERRIQAQFTQDLPELGAQKVEFNPRHPAVVRLFMMSTHREDEAMQKDAMLLAEQLFDNALCAAGLMDDPRVMLRRLTQIVTAHAERIAPTEPNAKFMEEAHRLANEKASAK
eukprot:TRINITY_DN23586_c0_g1_i1.p1 TRINITY_DN23586_c0_g1~~TRINITY_DN23586_c0_g1_i1.p1  ORF type:complete len:765 (-),score=256.67 TRINITY_DN23586_c0_g1_i1:136-2430(-)